MLEPSAMLQRLDAATREHHAELDGYWLDLMTQGVTADAYAAQLVRLYGFEAPLESALAYTPRFSVADRRDLSRSGMIAQDLISLGMRPATISRLPQCLTIVPFRDPLEALGWWYVSERSSQLYNAVKRHLVVRLPELASAVTFLASFDGIAAARWQQLGAVLDELSWKHGTEPIIAAADAGFRCARAWNAAAQPEPIARGA